MTGDVAMHGFRPKGGPRLHVDDAGGSGMAVVFQHGLCGDARQTAEVFPANSALRRITLECRGHGGSEPGDMAEFSIARFAEDVGELIALRVKAPVVIGGISMGAALAMRLAVVMPDFVRGLVIARPAWSSAAAPENMRANADVGALLGRMTQGEAHAQFMAGAVAKRLASEAPDNLASLAGFFWREPQVVTAALFQSISADGPGVTAAELSAIKVPTLVIATRMDAVHPLSLAQEIAKLIPGAMLVEITAKSQDRGLYVAEFKNVLDTFLKGFL